MPASLASTLVLHPLQNSLELCETPRIFQIKSFSALPVRIAIAPNPEAIQAAAAKHHRLGGS